MEEVIFGNPTPKTVALVEFPDAEAIKAVINSESYQSGIETRDKVFKDLNYYIGSQH